MDQMEFQIAEAEPTLPQVLTPDLQRKLVELMAQIILEILHQGQGANYEDESCKNR